MADSGGRQPSIEELLANHISSARSRRLPDEVTEKTKAHVLDTLAAMVSGSTLAAGRQASRFAERSHTTGPCTIAGRASRTTAINAAFINAMAAHADETDDSHLDGRFHPGCSIVPTALAIAESRDLSGDAIIQAAALGYDIGARFTRALGMTSPRSWTHSTHCLGGHFGAAAAAGALSELSPEQCVSLLAYTVQQAGGLPIWHRDRDHVQKAFDFGACAAKNAVFSVEFVASGATGVRDAISGEHGYLRAFAQEADPAALTHGLGSQSAILSASIKKWCVGSPIQAALDALEILIAKHKLTADRVEHLIVTLPDDRIKIVDNRDMPDVCVQHCLAVLLIDGVLPFESTHDKARMTDPDVVAVRERIKAVASPILTIARPARQAIVEVQTTDGEVVRHHTKVVSGTPENPMSFEQVSAKAIDLSAPLLGNDQAHALVETIAKLGKNVPARQIGNLIRVDA